MPRTVSTWSNNPFLFLVSKATPFFLDLADIEGCGLRHLDVGMVAKITGNTMMTHVHKHH